MRVLCVARPLLDILFIGKMCRKTRIYSRKSEDLREDVWEIFTINANLRRKKVLQANKDNVFVVVRFET